MRTTERNKQTRREITEISECQIRPDLKWVSIGLHSVENQGQVLQYRWVNDQDFQILCNGSWLDAHSIDFVFDTDKAVHDGHRPAPHLSTGGRMRERKIRIGSVYFRGLTKDGQWKYGSFLRHMIDEYTEYHGICDWKGKHFAVEHDTVNQYTTQDDKKGKMIFADDIVRYKYNLKNFVGVVVWDDTCCGWSVKSKDNFYGLVADRMEHLGNIHEHPELLEAE